MAENESVNVQRTEVPRCLTDADHVKLGLALATQRGLADRTVSADEVAKLLTWAEWTAFQASLLRLILKGKVLPNMTNANPNDYDDLEFHPAEKTLGPARYAEYISELEEINKTAKQV